MVRTLCRMGHPILRLTAKEVTRDQLKTDAFTQLLSDMQESMKHYGGIGIAAPQLGVSCQVALIELTGTNRYGEVIDLPLTTFINPKLEVLTSEVQGFWEGCLSVPGLRGYVERPRKLKVSFWDETGAARVITAEGFLATVIQHELDHLFGVLYVDRIRDSKLLAYQEEFEAYLQDDAPELD